MFKIIKGHGYTSIKFLLTETWLAARRKGSNDYCDKRVSFRICMKIWEK